MSAEQKSIAPPDQTALDHAIEEAESAVAKLQSTIRGWGCGSIAT